MGVSWSSRWLELGSPGSHGSSSVRLPAAVVVPAGDTCKAANVPAWPAGRGLWSHHSRSEEHTSELQSHLNFVCRLLLEKKNMDVIDCVSMDSHSDPARFLILSPNSLCMISQGGNRLTCSPILLGKSLSCVALYNMQ